MQPLARFAPRLLFDSIAISPASRTLRIRPQPVIRASTCLRCRIRIQTRRFADDSKPSTPPTPAKTVESPAPMLEIPLSKATSELPSAEDGRRSALSKRFSKAMDNLQGNVFIASQRINDLTGYSGIEALKSRIASLESRAQDAQEAVRSSRVTYKTTVSDRASTQREVTTLLARKDSWTPLDLERFTSLYRMDHSNEQAVQEAATRLADSEREAEHLASKLSGAILSRYHEEQIWSDKIRRMSTWGTWGLMVVNVILFFVFQFGFEPWRRRRLVHGFEEKVKEALEKEKMNRSSQHHGRTVGGENVNLGEVVAAGIEELQEEMVDDAKYPDPAVDALAACIEGEVGGKDDEDALDSGEIHVPTLLMQLRRPHTWRAAVQDLFSERLVSIRKQDITVIALEGAATGAALVTIIATLIFRPS